MTRCCIELISVPFDHGVKLINGRPGARFGPREIIKTFQELFKNHHFKDKVKIKFHTIKPVKCNVKRTHLLVTNAVKKSIKSGLIPIVIGGGHDISFASSKAISQTYKKIGQINIDAHYDVRPIVNGKITSGTPFRRLLDEKLLLGKNFVELGIHSPKNLKEHHDYIIRQKGTLIKLDDINKIGLEKAISNAFKIANKNTNTTVFDIDIDGVQKRFAPGCSAPCIKGFTKKQILKSALIAGRNTNISLFNLMEVNPLYDVNNKTVNLAAELLVNFIKGVTERKNNDN